LQLTDPCAGEYCSAVFIRSSVTCSVVPSLQHNIPRHSLTNSVHRHRT